MSNFIPVVKAQVLFSENFEISPVTSILNSGESQLINGPSPCGKATRGDASTFNSSSIDFLAAQNSSFFMAVNPQTPCGGFYNASPAASGLSFAGQDSLVFSCRYFKSNTLMWGPAMLTISFSNGTNTHSITADFSTLGAWTSYTTGLPSFLISPSVNISFSIGGGEGVAVDDILVYNLNPTSLKPETMNNKMAELKMNGEFCLISIENDINFMNFELYSLTGQLILSKNIAHSESIDTSGLPEGIYVYKLTDAEQRLQTGKLVK